MVTQLFEFLLFLFNSMNIFSKTSINARIKRNSLWWLNLIIYILFIYLGDNYCIIYLFDFIENAISTMKRRYYIRLLLLFPFMVYKHFLRHWNHSEKICAIQSYSEPLRPLRCWHIAITWLHRIIDLSIHSHSDLWVRDAIPNPQLKVIDD